MIAAECLRRCWLRVEGLLGVHWVPPGVHHPAGRPRSSHHGINHTQWRRSSQITTPLLQLLEAGTMQLDGGALSFSTLNSLFTTPLLANFALNRSSPVVPRAQPEAALMSKEPTNPEACRPQKNDIKTVSFPVPAYISTPSHQGPA
ncbi:unnamed protein product [Boreogadus saida]